MKLKIKICGMLEPDNIREVTELKPDFMGFIFYTKSPRYAGASLRPENTASLPPSIIKTGVFVDADAEEIYETAKRFSLDAVQLHGDESPALCDKIRKTGIQVIKAFNIDGATGFGKCNDYIDYTDYFLFDSVTDNHGGSGEKFNWTDLDGYDLDHPFLLSGGIGSGDAVKISEITNYAFHGIDLNSRFEINPGLKDTVQLKKFIQQLQLTDKIS